MTPTADDAFSFLELDASLRDAVDAFNSSHDDIERVALHIEIVGLRDKIRAAGGKPQELAHAA